MQGEEGVKKGGKVGGLEGRGYRSALVPFNIPATKTGSLHIPHLCM